MPTDHRLLYLVTVTTLLVVGAHGGTPLGSTIIAGSTNSIGDTVPSGGTTLGVATMLTNAVGAAVFHAVDLQFGGTLTIACPTAASSYTKPLLVTIVNGTTLIAMTATAHINISGVLGGMSRVSITGGSYTFVNADPSYFMQSTSALTITGSSALEIVGTFFTVPPSFTAGGTTAVLSTSSIALSNNSTLSIHGTTIGAYNVSVVGYWYLYVLRTLSLMNVSSGSTLSIVGVSTVVRGVVTGSVASSLLYGPMFVNGTVNVEDASIDGMWSKWIESTSISGTGQVHIVNVTTTGAGGMVSVPFVLQGDAPTFHVCRNYVNSVLCNLSTTNEYSCAPNISPRAVVCDVPPEATTTTTTTATTTPTTTALSTTVPQLKLTRIVL